MALKGFVSVWSSKTANIPLLHIWVLDRYGEGLRGVSPMAESRTVGPDYFGFYINQVAELFSQDEEFLPSSQKSELVRVLYGKGRGEGPAKHGNGTGAGSTNGPGSQFSSSIEAGISDTKRERLKALLKEAANVLSQEVDEMVGPVVSMCRLRSKLRSRKRQLLVTGAGFDSNAGQGPPVKQRMSSSSSACQYEQSMALDGSPNIEGSESRLTNTNSPCENLLENGLTSTEKECAFRNTTESALWGKGPAGPESLCDACGITYENGRESFLGSDKGKRNDKEEVDEDFQFLLENNSLQVEETINKYSDQLSESLAHMGNQLEGLLDTITAKCRPMKRGDKQQLKKLIQKLPPQNRDRVVEIIQHSKQSKPQPCNEIFIDLDKEDNKTLWRLYYYVKAVENARKLACTSSSACPKS